MIEATDENSRSTGPREHQFLDVSVDVKNHVAQFLLQNLNAAGTVIKGAQKEAANRWKMSVPTVKRIWKEAKRQAVQQRTTIRKMAKSLDMSKSTLHRFIQAKQLRAHSNAIKPQLTEANKIAKLKFCLSNLVQNPLLTYKVFLTLQSCLVEIMKDKGGNNYKIPHMNKGRLERIGELPTSLAVDEGLVTDTLEYLKQKDIEMGSLYDFHAIRMAFGF